MPNMCTQPIRILNPTRTFRVDSTKAFVTVPCNECPDCRAHKSQEWFVRIKQQIDDFNDDLGLTVFATHTYNEKYLPRFTYVDDDGNTHTVKVFCHDHILKMFKRIRRYFQKKGLPSNAIEYIVCSEYGDDDEYNRMKKKGKPERCRATMRPHYHTLFHLSGSAVRVLRDIGFYSTEYVKVKGEKKKQLQMIHRTLRTPEDLKKFFEKYWSYGFIRWSKSRQNGGPGIIVQSEFAGLYASKYVCKDIAFFNQKEVNSYLFDKEGNKIPEHFEKIKQLLPKHWQSQGYGIGLVEKVNENIYKSFSEGISFDDMRSDTKKGKKTFFQVPRYIEKKVLYDWNKDKGEYELNDVGRRVKSHLLDRKLQKLTECLEKRLDPVAFDEHIVDYCKSQFSLTKSPYELIRELFADRKPIELVLFNLVWRGKVAESVEQLETLDALSLDDFIHFSKEKYLDDLYPCAHISYNPEGYFKSMRKYQSERFEALFTFDACERFTNFNLIFDYLNTMQNKKRNEQQVAYENDRHNRKLAKNEVYGT